ncbi:MAG: hypothetical protein SNJ59_14255 [Aggregatilineales bacterium]
MTFITFVAVLACLGILFAIGYFIALVIGEIALWIYNRRLDAVSASGKGAKTLSQQDDWRQSAY